MKLSLLERKNPYKQDFENKAKDKSNCFNRNIKVHIVVGQTKDVSFMI